ncbi:MAG: hypothetical protein RIS47_1256 [Bacteroidota bacterium]|jgi:predicted alpha/beta hydrolase family esterase
MTNYFIVPGLGNSGAEHWQTYFESKGEQFQRIQQKEWDAPNCEDWVQNIDKALDGYPLETVVLIGHSLGCTAITTWASRTGKRIKGALLVAPSDIERDTYNFPATGFSPMSLNKLSFRSIVVASTNDPWVSMQRAQLFAEKWGSGLISIGAAGHINALSAYGKWEQGLKILSSLS